MWRLNGDGGKLFHAPGPATANALSPMDARQVDGTTRLEVDTERSRRRAEVIDRLC